MTSTPLGTDVAVVTGALTDPDPGDTASVRYEWYVNGAIDAGQTGATYPAAKTTRGDQLFARCFPTDGTTEGPYIETSVALVANSAPTVPVIALSPVAPVTTDQLDVLISTPSTDADNDNIVYNYTWTKDSNPTAQTAASVGSSYTNKGEIWSVSVLACDDFAASPTCASTSASISVTILNSAPVLQSVSLSPTTPTSLEDIVATEGTYNDADGDGVNFAIRWFHDKNDGNGFVLTRLKSRPSSRT